MKEIEPVLCGLQLISRMSFTLSCTDFCVGLETKVLINSAIRHNFKCSEVYIYIYIYIYINVYCGNSGDYK